MVLTVRNMKRKKLARWYPMYPKSLTSDEILPGSYYLVTNYGLSTSVPDP
jgi:hypothetical protein